MSTILRFLDKNGFSSYYFDNKEDENGNINKISLSIGIRLMEIGGCPILRQRSSGDIFFRVILILSSIALVILCTKGLFMKDNDLNEWLQLFQGSCITTQDIIKYIILMYHLPGIRKLIGMIDQMWRIESLPAPERQKYLGYFQLQNRGIQIFVVITICTLVILHLKTVFGFLPVPCWMPENKYGKAAVCFVGMLFVDTMYWPYLGIDLIMVPMANNVSIQFKILQERVGRIDYTKSTVEKELAVCMEHHAFLLQYMNKIQKHFSLIILSDYGFSAIANCSFVIKILFSDNFDPLIIFELIFYVSSLTIQFALYCFTLAQITIESEAFVEYIFHSDWYNSHGRYKKNLVLMIARCQNNRPFTAGGMAVINREAVIQLFRFTFSIMTLLKTIKDKGNNP